jgi:hypothetical protein
MNDDIGPLQRPLGDGKADDITIDVPLTMRNLQVIAKSLGITSDVIAKNAMKCLQGSNRRRELNEEFALVEDALINVREALSDLMAA